MTIRLALIAPLIACLVGAAPSARGESSVSTSRLSPEALDRSLDLGREYILNAQRPDGSFVYEFDAKKGAAVNSRDAVREIGGIWALAFLHRRHPTQQTADAVIKSLKLQDSFARKTASGGRYLTEPAAREWTTNVVAIHILALQDFLAADFKLDPELQKKLKSDLADEVKFLLSLRVGNGRFYSTYRTSDGHGVESPNGFSDGEALLALVRAAKEQGADPALQQAVRESGAVMYTEYVRNALRADPHSELTATFYQWGSMAFYELYTSEWPGTKPYAARTIVMARWMLDVQKLDKIDANTAQVYEGLTAAWELARLTNDAKNQQYIGAAIDRGLTRLFGFQIGSPLANEFAVPKALCVSPKAKGGVVSAPGEPRIRVDMVQHQMHATLLAREFFFRTN